MAVSKTNEQGLGKPGRLVRPYRSTYRDRATYLTYMQLDFPNGSGWTLVGNGVIESLQAGTDIEIDNTDPNNPIISVKATLSGDKNFVYDQNTPASVWNVAHNLGKRPSVGIVNSAGDEVEGDVLHVDDNNLTITFSAPFSGKAYIN